MEKSEWPLQPKNPEKLPETHDDITLELFEEGGFVDRIKRLNQRLRYEDDYDIDDQTIFDLVNLFGYRFMTSVPCNVTAEGHQYMLHEDGVHEEATFIDRSDLYFTGVDVIETADGPQLAVCMTPNIDEYQQIEQPTVAIIPESILHFSADLAVEAHDLTSTHIHAFQSILSSPTFQTMPAADRRACLNQALSDCEIEILSRFDDYLVEVECHKYYHVDDSNNDRSINWQRSLIESDSPHIPEVYYLSGMICAVVIPEFMDGDDERGFRNHRSFPISGGMPHVVIRTDGENLDERSTGGNLQFVPIDEVDQFVYLG